MTLSELDVVAALAVCVIAAAVATRPRRARGVPITTRAIQKWHVVMSRPIAGGRRVSRGRHRSPRGSNPRPLVRADEHGAPAITNPRPASSSSPAPPTELEAWLATERDRIRFALDLDLAQARRNVLGGAA